MNILPYSIETTNDKLTSRAGLLTIAQLMSDLKLQERIDQHFTLPKSNHGFNPSAFIQTFILMQHEGSVRLDDVRHLNEDEALKTILGLKIIPKASTLGAWLRRMGKDKGSLDAWVSINKIILKTALHNRKSITLDIDASEILANKKGAKLTYNNDKGYMPMIGHIAETGQVVACDFRDGNAAPAKENYEFILQCIKSLPENCYLKAVRIDSAGYQTAIIKYCDEKNITFSIRAKLNNDVKEEIYNTIDADWKPLIDKNGNEVKNQETYRVIACIGDHEKAFNIVVQRTKIKGQSNIDFNAGEESEELNKQGYMYRGVATNDNEKSDSDIIHYYNQRAEDSENRIKELKLDFGGDTMPCSDFKANRLYFLICSMSFNLFALMRHLLPEELSHHRMKTIRWRVYAMAAKVVKTGRKWFVKLEAKNQAMLEKVMQSLRRFEAPDI